MARRPGRQCLLHVLSRLLLSADHGSWFDNTFGWWREAQGDNVYLMLLSRLLFSVAHGFWFDYTRGNCWREAQGDNVYLMFYHVYCFQSTTGPGLITHVAGGGKLRETMSTSYFITSYCITSIVFSRPQVLV